MAPTGRPAQFLAHRPGCKTVRIWARVSISTRTFPISVRILFFGNDYSRLSIPCLQAALDTGHSVTVGAHRAESVGLIKTARIALKTRGPAAVIRGGVTLLLAYARRLHSPSGAASLTELARQRGAPVIDVTHLDSPASMESIRAFAPDIILVAGFSRILKRAVIELPRLGCINVHPSLLPRYRGPNPMYWVLANGGESHRRDGPLPRGENRRGRHHRAAIGPDPPGRRRAHAARPMRSGRRGAAARRARASSSRVT